MTDVQDTPKKVLKRDRVAEIIRNGVTMEQLLEQFGGTGAGLRGLIGDLRDKGHNIVLNRATGMYSYAEGEYKAKKNKPRKPKLKRGRPRKSERPQFTSPAHAEYLRDKLAVPLTLLVTLRHMTTNTDPDVRNMMHESIETIKMARLFVGRFVANNPMEE